MLQKFDSSATAALTERPQWLALLARAPMQLLEVGLGEHAQAEPHWLRRPETGLMMVQGRTGGTGQRFNLGEVTITRCALRLPAGADQNSHSHLIGVAYVIGRVHKQARLAAIADALLQDSQSAPWVRARLLEPIRAHLERLRAQRKADSESTKVEFFTVARETGNQDPEEAEQ
jgi:alpha-D-ribose 1-methylphosphonate 5-triphosphate synthase subunit PhnG